MSWRSSTPLGPSAQPSSVISKGPPWALAPELEAMFGERLPAAWGSEPMARLLAGVVAPSLADDQPFLQFMAKAMRSSVSPGAAQAWLRMIRDIDVREALPQIRVPTLILHRTGDRAVDVGASRYAAGRIPGARLVELPDGDNLPFVGDSEAVAAEIEEFLTGSRLGLEVRAAVHTGEVELRDGDIGGIAVHIAVHIAARVMGLARPNEVLVSSTVKDLVAGAEIRFEDRSVQSLRGVPGQWQLFAAFP
jgi:hypothetical protein